MIRNTLTLNPHIVFSPSYKICKMGGYTKLENICKENINP